MATIAENLQTIQTIKNNIKTSIENKGVSVGDVSFTEYSTKIDEITTGGSGGDFDFSVIGYDTTLNNSCNNKIQEDIDYSTTILNNWNPSTTFANNQFSADKKLVYCPLIDTTNVTTMSQMFYNCTNLQFIPLLNTSNVTDMGSMFRNCSSLTSIPQLDTSKAIDISAIFGGCSKLTSIPSIDTSSATDMYNVFGGCYLLTTIPLLNTSKVTIMSQMFQYCSALQTIPQLDTSNVTNMQQMFNGCSSLQSLPLLDCGNVTNISSFFEYTKNITTLTDLGGFKNLKINWNDNNGLYRLPNLTYESVMNVINNLYDFRNNGDDTTTRTIQFNSNSKALLSDADIAIATNKGWVIS